MWFFQDLIRPKVYSRIDFKFLIPGHTYCPTDRYFVVIEKHTSRVENVYLPSQWYDYVRDAVIEENSRLWLLKWNKINFEITIPMFEIHRAFKRSRWKIN